MRWNIQRWWRNIGGNIGGRGASPNTFLITEVLRPVTYHLQLPVSWRIHNVFHATLLKPYKENEIYGPNFHEPPSESENNEEVYEVDFILNHQKRGWGYQYYVKWKGYPISEVSWEPEQAFSDDGNMLSLYEWRHQLWTLKKIRSILKQTSMDSITPSNSFDNYCDERIWIMKNSADEYARFLKQLDNLIARMDLTMETTRLPFKRKTVRFAEHNEIFLIPPRETPSILTIPNFDVQNLQSLFPDLFYWTMPPSRNSHSRQTAFSSNVLFWHSSTTTDIQHVYQLLAGQRDIQDNYTTFEKWSFDRKKNQTDDYNTNRTNSPFSENLPKQPFKKFAQADSTRFYNQSFIYEKKETIAIIIGLDCHHLWYRLTHLPFLPPSKDQDNDLAFPQLFLNPRITLVLQFLEPHLAPSTIL